jgi:hypothetical protein
VENFDSNHPILGKESIWQRGFPKLGIYMRGECRIAK